MGVPCRTEVGLFDRPQGPRVVPFMGFGFRGLGLGFNLRNTYLENPKPLLKMARGTQRSPRVSGAWLPSPGTRQGVEGSGFSG